MKGTKKLESGAGGTQRILTAENGEEEATDSFHMNSNSQSVYVYASHWELFTTAHNARQTSRPRSY